MRVTAGGMTWAMMLTGFGGWFFGCFLGEGPAIRPRKRRLEPPAAAPRSAWDRRRLCRACPPSIRPSAHPIRRSTFATVCRFPLSAPRRPNAATVQRRGDLPKRLRPGGLGLANGRRNAVGEGVGASGMVCVGYGAGLGEPGIAEGLSAGLGGGQAALVRSVITRARARRGRHAGAA